MASEEIGFVPEPSLLLQENKGSMQLGCVSLTAMRRSGLP